METQSPPSHKQTHTHTLQANVIMIGKQFVVHNMHNPQRAHAVPRTHASMITVHVHPPTHPVIIAINLHCSVSYIAPDHLEILRAAN